jgi:hypothetical protein
LLTLHLHQVGWKDLHLLAAEHAQHTTKPLARRTLPRATTSAVVEGLI